MFKMLAKKIFGTSNDRELKRVKPIVEKINSLESKMKELSPEQLKEKTNEFRERIKNGSTLESILPEAYAVLREAAFRSFGQRAYDVQLIGGIVLNSGNVAEMRTGEGKTLTAAFPSYLNAISGHGVHVITVNDYLAQRDADKMRKLFSLLDITVGCNISGMIKSEKDAAYACDITYGTANEFGFDYLRDNMALDVTYKAQRELNFALIDEVDSVLIDEARTPLIISDADQDSTDLYIGMVDLPKILEEGKEVKSIIENREEGDYYIDLKTNNVYLTERGYERSEEELIRLGILKENDSLYSNHNIPILSVLISTIKANTIFHKNKQYIVSEEGEVKIIDEHTGRIMEGRRWNDGIHQAIEAKERVKIKAETITLATITLQYYFKLYNKLAGMTGTADTEAMEFNSTYHLDTIVIPTNKPIKRTDEHDKVFISFQGKLEAVINEVKRANDLGQPILLGTSSIENNDVFYNALKEAGLNANILNAKNHLLEADIIAQAGKKGAITVATNMAGRGTDIILGGNIESNLEEIKNNEILSEESKLEKITSLQNQWSIDHEEVIKLGGLHVIGTERNESRRIDNQLRGRAGRQGDPGSSVFFASFDDDLLKPYSENAKKRFKAFNISEKEVLQGRILTKLVEGAQEKVEKIHFEMRKNLMEFDETISIQREYIYDFRNDILNKNPDVSEDQKELNYYAEEIIKSSIMRKLEHYIPTSSILELWDLKGLVEDIEESYDIALPITLPATVSLEGDENISINETLSENEKKSAFDDIIYGAIFEPEKIHSKIYHFISETLKIKLMAVDSDHLVYFKKTSLLQTIDKIWREHLTELDHLKKGIHLRGYAQKDPKQEYKREAFKLFQLIRPMIEDEFTNLLMKIQIQARSEMSDFSQEFNNQLDNVAKKEIFNESN